ncbi:MAG: hypothetical protein ACYDDO_07070 [Acidiferrobacterales bacterium]
MSIFQILPRIPYLATSYMLLSINLLLVAFGVHDQWLAVKDNSAMVADKLLDAIGVIVISIALFAVSKYLTEEEVLKKKFLIHSNENPRQTLTRFMSIIAITVCMEALVSIFRAGKTNVDTTPCATLLLLGGVGVVIALAVFRRINADTASYSVRRI